MKTKREFLKLSALTGAGLLMPWKWGASSAFAAQEAGPKTKPRKDVGKYVVVDAQFHHLPLSVIEKIDKMTFETKEAIEHQERSRKDWAAGNPTTKKLSDLDGALRYMEECGINRAMIQMPSRVVAGMEICRVTNDGLAKAAKENPGKFIPLAAVSYLHGQESIDEAVRAKNELGLKGVSVITNERGITMDDPKLKPFFKKVSELQLPVFVHPPTQQRGLWGGTKYDMDGHISREYDVIKSFVEVLQGVLPEFPDLNFVFAHFGGGVPSLLGRIMSWYSPPKASGIPKKDIELPMTIKEFEESGYKDYFNKLLDRCYFDMAGTGGWLPEVKHAYAVLKPDRLNFASDYPHEMARAQDMKAYINGIKALKIPEEDKVKMLGGNMLRLCKV